MAEGPKSSNLRSCVNHFRKKGRYRNKRFTSTAIPYVRLSADEEIIRSGCGPDLSGPAYRCSKSNCEFILHKSCFNLERVIEHLSHPDHPLTLLSIPPKNYIGKAFICNACYDTGTSFDYHCASCNFDLHVGCANLPKKMKHADHQHPLTLYYSSSCNRGIKIFICDVCDEIVPKRHWVYYCAKCDYGTHLSCTYPEC
ncbi:hypothetical protein REPUB_Repub04eG0045500 [Reevesia pubescens]